MTIPMTGGGDLLVAWKDNSSSVVLAFQSPNDTVSQQILNGENMTVVNWLAQEYSTGTPAASAAALQPFNSLLAPGAAAGGNLSEVGAA